MSKEENKEHFPVETEKWNSTIENNLKNIGETCKGYKWMYLESAKITLRYYNIVMCATIIVGPLAAFLETISLAINGGVEFQVIVIASGFVSGILASVVRFSKFNEKSLEHKTAAAKFASLEGNIRRQLSLYRQDRVNAGKYFQWISSSFDDLIGNSPLLESSVQRTWTEFAHKHHIVIPKEYEETVINTNGSRDLANVSEIQINQNESSADLRRMSGEKKEKETEQRDIMLKIPEESVQPEINHFTDPRMQYEMSRMSNS